MQDLTVKKVEKDDLAKLLELYTHLNKNPFPIIDNRIEDIWERILADKNHYILGGYIGEKLVSTCAISIIENLTHQQMPYALIENVVTRPDCQNKGYGTRILDFARDIAAESGCYKIMLMTGSKKESTLNFYKKAGYDPNEKTAFIQRLDEN